MTTLARQLRRRREFGARSTRIGELEAKVERQDNLLSMTRTDRLVAQRGLLWYLLRLERLHTWLVAQPDEVQATLAPTLQSLGLYDVKAGYHPSVVAEVRAAVLAGQLPPIEGEPL